MTDSQHERICVSEFMTKLILDAAHDRFHLGFDQMYQDIVTNWYIHGLIKLLCLYLHHCPKCLILQTCCHQPYRLLQSIKTLPTPFHMISIDFVLALPTTKDGLNSILSIMNKFSKRIILIFRKAMNTASDWVNLMLNCLKLINWGLSKVILSDQDPKFLSEL